MNLFEQFRQVEKAVADELGEFTLFGLFERDDLPGEWDVVVSSDRLRSDRASLLLLTEGVRRAIGGGDWWRRIGKYVILPVSDPFVQAVLSRMPNDYVAHDLKVLNNLLYDGEIIRNAVIITAIREPIRMKEYQSVAA